MNIKILGSGCPSCKRLEEITRKTAIKLNIDAEFEKVTDYAEMMKYAIMSTPALVIDEKVVSAGRIPTEAEIGKWISA